MINKELVETTLKKLGTILDVSEYIEPKYKNEMPYSYLIFQNKYNDSTDDSVCIEVYANNTYVISNNDLPYGCYSQKEVDQLKNLFKNSVFDINVFERKEPFYYASVSVDKKASNLDEVSFLVNEFRSYNDLFLKDKVIKKLGDDGDTYLFRND